MKIHCLQHVPFEGPAYFSDWAAKKGFSLSVTHSYRGEKLPSPDSADLFLFMGGPMSVHDIEKHSWISKEIELIQQAVEKGKRVVGICLGAQLIACALGGDVKAGTEKEIGWFPLKEREGIPLEFQGIIPPDQKVFHWHGEQCIAPPGALSLWESKVCREQGFLVGSQVLALQFHLETTEFSASELISHSRHELVESPLIQSEKEMLSHLKHFEKLHLLLDQILEQWLS